MPFAIGAGILAGGSLLSGLFGAGASKDAANQQAQSNAQALAFQQNVFNTTQANLAPYLGTGTNALYSLAQLYGVQPGGVGGAGTSSGTAATPGATFDNGQSVPWLAGGGGGSSGVTSAAAGAVPPAPGGAAAAYQNFTQTPAYQFPLQQGLLAVDRSAASRGGLASGGTLKAATQYGQGYASQNFGNYVSQLQQLATMGQNSGALTGSQGNQAAGNVSNILSTIGGANAAGTVGAANSITGGLNNGLALLANSNSGFGGGGVQDNTSTFLTGGG